MEIFENIINSYANESITTSTILAVLVMVAILAIYEFLYTEWYHIDRSIINHLI